MSVSKAPAYRAAMFTLIKTALVGQAEVEINYGLISPSKPDDLVLISAVGKSGQFKAIGAQSIDEYLDLRITISCARGGDDLVNGVSTQQIASERAWALLALVETRVRSDVTLGGLVNWCICSRAEEIESQEEDGIKDRYADITATFTAQTRI